MIKTIKGGITYHTTYNGIAGTYPITINQVPTLANYDISKGTGTLQVNKANYDTIPNIPTFTTTYSKGAQLGSLNLSQYNGFSWDASKDVTDSTEIAPNGVRTYTFKAIYCADPTNYNPTSVDITVHVKQAQAKITHNDLTDGALSAKWTGKELSLETIIGAKSNNTDDDFVLTFTVKAPIFDASKTLTEVTDGGVYEVTISGNGTKNFYAPYEVTVTVKITSAIVGTNENDWFTVEDAINTANKEIDEKKVTEQTVTLKGNAFISDDITIASGTTLILPSDEDSSSSIDAGTYGKDTDDQNKYVDNIDSEIKYKLTIVNGINVIVNGNILVRGLLGANGGSFEGHTCGNHSQIINNGTMKFNTGSQLGMRGYMKGSGKVFFYSGSTAYSPFVVRDYGGGTHSKGAYQKGPVAPFLQYEMPNIQCESFTYGGAKHIAYCALYVPTFFKLVEDIVNIYSSDGVLKINDDETSYVRKTYSNNKTTLQFVGDITMGSLKIQQYGQEVDMSKVFFPISYLYNIIVGDGNANTTLTAAYDYKLMPGTSLTIEPNATVNLTGRAIVYNTINYSTSAARKYPVEKGPAKLIVNGTLKISGGFGGIIRSTANTGHIMVDTVDTSNLTVTSIEGEGTGNFLSQKFTKTATVEEVARAINSDENTTTNLSAGTTYTYNGSEWVVA